MTWSTFIIYLSLSYMTYYTANLLYDLHHSKSNHLTEPNATALFYHENSAPFAVPYGEQQTQDQEDSADTATAGSYQSLSTDHSPDLKTITAQAKSDLQALNKRI